MVLRTLALLVVHTLLLGALASCDTAEPPVVPTLPRERTIVLSYLDSLFAVQVTRDGDLGQPEVVRLADGRFHEVGGFIERNELLESNRLLALVTDLSAPGRVVVEIPASDPAHPQPLGQPGEGFITGYISPATGRAYGLRREQNGESWTVVRVEQSTSVPLVATDAIGPEDWPQTIFVSDDETVAAVTFLRRPEQILGEPQNLLVLHPGRSASVLVPELTPAVLDIRFSETTEQLYLADFHTGEVFAIDPETGEYDVLFGPLPRIGGIGGRRLFLIDEALVTFRRNPSTTSLYRYALADGVLSEFMLPIPLSQANEHGDYLMFRAFDRAPTELMTGPVETFVGVCTSALRGSSGPLVPAETFQVPIPYFARQFANISHSFECAGGMPQ